MSPYIFFSIFLTLFALLNLYIVKRFINKLHIKQNHKRNLKLFLYLNYFGILGYAIVRYYPTVPNWIFFLFSVPIGIIFLLFITAIIYDILHSILIKTSFNTKRREFLKIGLDYFSLVFAFAISGRAIYEAKTVELESVKVKIKNLNKSYKIVQLSDIHIGGLIEKDFIKEVTAKVNELNPDVVVITGDLVDIGLKYANPVLKELEKLKSKYGTFFVVGNHEYFHGVEKVIKAVNDIGIKTLENEAVFIGEKEDGFNLAGVYDYHGYRVNHYEPDLNKALQDCDKNRPTILLAHQPVFIKEVKSGVDLMLSGHTHGGQIYPFRALVKIVQPYLAGLYQHNDKLQIYVNKGTGFWGPPMRLGASSEITSITIS